MIKVKELRCTCGCCPTQWHGTTEDGREIYIRYRWGHLTAYVGTTPGADALDGDAIFSAAVGDSLDGSMDYAQLKEHTEGTLELPAAETPVEQLIDMKEQIKKCAEKLFGDSLMEPPKRL